MASRVNASASGAVGVATMLCASLATAQPQPAAQGWRDTARVGRPSNRISYSSSLVSRVDDNVNRDTSRLTSIGAAAGVSVRFESRPVRPTLAVEYGIAIHRYSATTRFNRVSQRLRSTLSSRVTHWLTVELVGEGALKGSSEDRDVSDQVTLLPRAEFRLTDANRARVGVSQRWRRYPTDSVQNAVNRYVVAELRHTLGGGASIETEARLEGNDARGARFDYRRSSVSCTYSAPLGPVLAFELGMQYRIQEYSGRVVRINRVDHRRVDHRIEPSAALALRLGASAIALSYDPEWRRSNDPAKVIDQQILQLSVRHRW